jgi:hypothetical protein
MLHVDIWRESPRHRQSRHSGALGLVGQGPDLGTAHSRLYALNSHGLFAGGSQEINALEQSLATKQSELKGPQPCREDLPELKSGVSTYCTLGINTEPSLASFNNQHQRLHSPPKQLAGHSIDALTRGRIAPRAAVGVSLVKCSSMLDLLQPKSCPHD